MQAPKFDELPVNETLGLRHSWGVFGEDDELGTVNRLTPEGVLRAATLVRDGMVINLSLPVTEPDPPLFSREALRHEIFTIGRNSWDDKVDNLFLQASSQWDGLLHQRCREFGFYGGRQLEPHEGNPDGTLGVDRWVRHGMVGRGVLLDVAGHLGDLDPFESREIDAGLLREVAEAQRVELGPGTMLCVRLGWTEAYRERVTATGEPLTGPMHCAGLRADEEMSRFLWDSGVAALALDNPAIEVLPNIPAVGSLHRRLLPLLGMALGELFWFADLAAACRERQRWDFMFVAVPLNVPGGVGSPANSIAVL